jgi:peptidoglycan/LPS O-acetylase OafA/YrhL
MTQTPSQRRAGRLVFLAFIVLFTAFAALVIWLVTEPVRDLRRQQAPVSR